MLELYVTIGIPSYGVATESPGEKGLKIFFVLPYNATQKDTLRVLKKEIKENKLDWISNEGNNWYLDLTMLKESKVIKERAFQHSLLHEQSEKTELEYLEGTIKTELEFQIVDNEFDGCSQLIIDLTEDEIMKKETFRIFLSHKGFDKPMIRKFNTVLKTIGFDPWLDEDNMHAGVNLERGILNGFKESCAAVFFITPNYRDENYLATEINYAIAEKREKGARFSIITLVFTDEGNIIIPDLLKQYVWKKVENELQALNEIIRALPIELREIGYKIG